MAGGDILLGFHIRAKSELFVVAVGSSTTASSVARLAAGVLPSSGRWPSSRLGLLIGDNAGTLSGAANQPQQEEVLTGE